MLFNSFPFLIFFPIVTLLYFAVPHRFRWILLLVASCYFYMSFIPVYILILGFTILVDYVGGLLIESAAQDEQRKRKLYLAGCIIANVLVLALFKYYNFLVQNVTEVLQSFGIGYSAPYLSILLPIGLSFHTFQGLSYAIEVYRGSQKAERNLGIFSLYVMFYPQLVAGPIERPQNMLHQFREYHRFDYGRVVDGLKLMAWGLFKKVVIADHLAMLTTPVFGDPRLYPDATLAVAAIFFTFQIYCDFSGYSDIAIGAARVMGFNLMLNFNRPYHSRSIAEFWRRWHISLSSWFRDYLYIPLGGNRVSRTRYHFNLFCVFLVSGLWHGANWTFILWGILHWIYLAFGIITQGIRARLVELTGLDRMPRFHHSLQVTITFVLVVIAWVFFRAQTVSDAVYILHRIGAGLLNLLVDPHMIQSASMRLPISANHMYLSFLLIGVLEMVHLAQTRGSIPALIARQPVIVRWSLYYAFMFALIALGMYQESSFIYFQF